MTLTSGHAKNLQKPKGKLGVVIPGLGAVATTFIAGVETIRKGYQPPIGSMTQMGHIRLGKRTDNRQPLVKDFIPLADINDMVFGGWDIFTDNAYESAKNCGVLPDTILEPIATYLKSIKPMKAVFSKDYVKKIDGPNVKTGKNKMDLAEQLMKDMEDFKKTNNCDRLVMIWCASTEVYTEPTATHSSVKKFEEGLRNNDP
ncbi:MAG: inositol-3-phosphate synthase, partial [Pseudomonadota bacterium]